MNGASGRRSLTLNLKTTQPINNAARGHDTDILDTTPALHFYFCILYIMSFLPHLSRYNIKVTSLKHKPVEYTKLEVSLNKSICQMNVNALFQHYRLERNACIIIKTGFHEGKFFAVDRILRRERKYVFGVCVSASHVVRLSG